jgi:hypothetical protein
VLSGRRILTQAYVVDIGDRVNITAPEDGSEGAFVYVVYA